MSNSEQNKPGFEEDWRKAFENAELVPDSRVWSGIEGHLQGQNRWQNRRRFAYYSIAASVIVCLTCGLGWWAYSGKAGSQVAAGQESKKEELTALGTRGNEKAFSSAEITKPASPAGNQVIASNTTPVAPADHWNNSGTEISRESMAATPATRWNSARDKGADDTHPLELTASKSPSSQAEENVLHTGNKSDNKGAVDQKPNSSKSFSPSSPVIANRSINCPLWPAEVQLPDGKENRSKLGPDHATIARTAREEANEKKGTATPEAISPAILSAKGVSIFPVAMVSDHRLRAQMPVELVFAKPAIEETPVRKSPLWISSSFTPSYFNSNVQMLYQPATVLNGVAVTSNSLSNVQRQEDQNQPNFSYALGINAGKDLSKRLSIEGGVQYLYNSASLQTHAYVLNTATSEKYPIISDLLSGTTNTVESPVYKANVANTDQVSLTNTQATQLNPTSTPIDLRNQYQYIGIPVKLGYQLNRQEKLRFVASAGVSTDLFLKNTIGGDSPNIYSTEITAGDQSAYRTVNLSGLLGLGIHYRYTDRLSIMLEPTYRTALFSTTKTTSNVRILPTNMGVGLGMKFHF